MSLEGLAAIAFVLGIITNVILPYLVEVQAALKDPKNDPGVFSWKYVVPKAIAVVILLLTLPLVYPNLESVLDLSVQAAFVAGFGVAALGDLGRRGYNALKSE